MSFIWKFEHTISFPNIIKHHPFSFLRQACSFEDGELVIGKKRPVSRQELEDEIEKLKRVQREFYRFAVEELMSEVHESTGKGVA